MQTDHILKIARLYYEQNKTQEEIGQQLSVSRSTISRALKLARERGYIRTVVVAPSSSAVRLEGWFRERFNLQHVVIVPGRGKSTDILDSVAYSAATYLDHIVPDEGILTVVGGRTLLSISRQIRPAYHPNLQIVPAMGGWVGQTAISANEVAREIALCWGAQASSLFVPAMVSDSLARQTLLREESIRLALQKAKSAQIACVGLAGISPSPDALQHPYESSSGHVPPEDLKCLLELGAVGETCAQFFDVNGQALDSWNHDKSIAIAIEDLKKMSAVVMVGAGLEKARAFLGACRGNFMTALIITEELAFEIEQLDKVM